MTKIIWLCSLMAAVWCALSLAGCNGASTPPNNTALVGSWGATDTDALLTLTPNGGQFRVMSACGWGGPLNAPAILDANNHFAVAGTYTSNIPPQAVIYDGIIGGNSITLRVIGPGDQTRATYTLIKDVTPTPFTGPCPG